MAESTKEDVPDVDMEKPVKVRKPPRDKLHPHYCDPKAEISFLTSDRWIFRIHLHFLKKRSAFFADMSEIATSSDQPSEPMDLDLDRYAMEKYAEYVYNTAKYPTHLPIITGKGNPEKMFKALANFEKLQDETLVKRIKEDIIAECKTHTEKAATCVFLALGAGRSEMAAELMLSIPAVSDEEQGEVLDMAKTSAETAGGISNHQLDLLIKLASQYRAGRPGDRGLWRFISIRFLAELHLPPAKKEKEKRKRVAQVSSSA